MVITLRNPNVSVDGKSRKDYVRIYWEKLCPLTKSESPVWDNTGSKDDSFNALLDEPLYMLSPSMYPQTSVVRNINVPDDKSLLIPVIPVIASKFETDGNLVAAARCDQNSINLPSLSVELDGTNMTIPDLNSYNIQAGTMSSFDVNFPSPEDAIFSLINAPVDALDKREAIAAGRYIWTEPLISGAHTVKYKGFLTARGPECLEPAYTEDILYLINYPTS